MFLRGTLLGILLFSIFWTETALAGSSFLSPEFKKLQQQNDPTKTTAKIHRRGTGGFWDADKPGADDNNGLELQVTVPFEIGFKVTEEEYQEYGQTLEKMLQDMLKEKAKETPGKN